MVQVFLVKITSILVICTLYVQHPKIFLHYATLNTSNLSNISAFRCDKGMNDKEYNMWCFSGISIRCWIIHSFGIGRLLHSIHLWYSILKVFNCAFHWNKINDITYSNYKIFFDLKHDFPFRRTPIHLILYISRRTAKIPFSISWYFETS